MTVHQRFLRNDAKLNLIYSNIKVYYPIPHNFIDIDHSKSLTLFPDDFDFLTDGASTLNRMSAHSHTHL